MSAVGFDSFYRTWLHDLQSLLSTLRDALQQSMPEDQIERLVGTCHSKYIEYVNTKIAVFQQDASFAVSSMRLNPLEAAFSWMGGWRPTSAVVLAYSLMGMQIERDLQKLLEGIEIPTMGALSATQLSMLDSLQQRIRASEDELTNRLSVLQMLLGDQMMAKATGANRASSEPKDFLDVRQAMAPTLAGLRDLLIEAEKLRGETVQEMLNILRPFQAGQYALAAFEMAIAVQKLGNQKEGQSHSSELLSDPRNDSKSEVK